MVSKITWLTLTLLLSSLTLAQETVIYQFGAAGPNDGAEPNGGLVFDAAGNMYGTTVKGGSFGFGTAFELSQLKDGTWQESILYNFCSAGNLCQDGQFPKAGLIFDAGGNLYGTTTYGGAGGSGTVFELSPPSQPGGSWTEQVLWSFPGADVDGLNPYGGVTIDAAGNLYGTTSGSVTEGAGLVFELSPGPNGWTESLLHVFCLNYPDCSDGAQPEAGVTFGNAGNLYGTTMFGGQPDKVGWGVAYELSPTESGWTENVLKVFTSKTGGQTRAGITIDPTGNLYGGLSQGGPSQCGGYFRLLPFEEVQLSGACSPGSDLVYSSGALFGSTGEGGTKSLGEVFKVTKKGSHVDQTILYNFCQQANCADGSIPNGSPTLRNGQLYGATEQGGLYNSGLIYRIAE
ncbi:MAG: choice-of-anchor tandem repeat GloVer-containing protein [Terriglobales bacterium]